MTDLPVEEQKAVEVAWHANSFTGITYEHDERGWFNTGYKAAREYSKQREEKLRKALREIAGDYGCGLIEPPDVSLPPQGNPCRERRPDEPETWCVSCIASAALAENGDSEPGIVEMRPSLDEINDGLGDRRPGA